MMMNRTVCACERCVACCKTQPGPLIPGDMERIAAYLGMVLNRAKKYFQASKGAFIGLRNGTVVNIPTITPKQKADGSCVFLDGNDRCMIHSVAPFGCAYFDMHMEKEEADRRSKHAIMQQMNPEYQKLREEL